ncbi:hypothetical protein BGZ99_005545 [Dissophora globulifera]|uniref:FAD-binding FR-type domain-containing protein n=1 Tax=Dissophora globulifera TaxID=979702 RepID=A0A9P6RWN3_9FUNG|nr:hypothetical protein BGZ99_005545 [Dissophora globulifera]
MPSPFSVFILLCILFPVGYTLADYELTWERKIGSNFIYNVRDYYVLGLCIAPTVLGHIATTWGHYYRAEREFQHSIAKITTPASERQKISLWEQHIWCGYTVKFWIMATIAILMNLSWFIYAMVVGWAEMQTRFGNNGIPRIIANSSGYAAIACSGMIMFFVLRRSMLHAIGFTYSEIIPLHRWLGTALVGWVTLHAVGYISFWATQHKLPTEFNFRDIDRGSLNMSGVFAYGALCLVGLFSFPIIRRRFYLVFITFHRFFGVMFFIGMTMHNPNQPMMWYYILPTIVLFLVDRFVPKMMMARTVSPEATCSLNADANVIRMTFTSPEPMKPYYPGDHIMVQIPSIGTLYHPFTIASYWPEDPYSITLFIRTFEDSKLSWTCSLAKLCGTEDKRIRVKANVDGVFGGRHHDYLNAETLIVFVAGTAMTRFIPLIKAIAAQIAFSREPLRMRLHFICTFRTRSELHAYGSFLHQITRDPRFTTWLHVEIYVSRPDKSQTLLGAHAHIVKNDIQVPVKSMRKEKKRLMSLRSAGSMLKRALSERTIVADVEKSQPASPTETTIPIREKGVEVDETAANSKESSIRRTDSIHTVVDLEAITEEVESTTNASGSNPGKVSTTLAAAAVASSPITMAYQDQPLPTFQASNSTSVATRWAKLDLFATCVLIFVPLAAWCGARTVHWEGHINYCATSKIKGIYLTANCYWKYLLIPGVIHIVVAAIAGYFAVWLARTILLRRGQDVEKGLSHPEFPTKDERPAIEDGNWDEGDVVYTRGRLDVKQVIQGFVDAGVGKKEDGSRLVSVFGGGPEGFVDMVEKQAKAADWFVDFHRETWAP